MENQTRFDLNRALLAWKAELAGEPGISAENVRELETHLLESIAVLKRSGQDDQEAFLNALQQMGSRSKIGAEFAKENILRIWRDRVFWVAFAGFLLMLPGSAIEWPTVRVAHWTGGALGEWAAVTGYSVLNLAPVLCATLLFATGRIEIFYSRICWLFARRRRLGTAGVLLTFAANLPSSRVINVLTIYELGFLGFALVMMPPEMRAAAQVKSESARDWRNSIRLWRDRLFWIAITQLAIGAWNQAAEIGAVTYIRNLPELKRWLPPWLGSIIFFLVWLIPMAVVGVALAKAWLSPITRMLRSRSSALAAGTVLLVINCCLNLWHFHYGWIPGRIPLAEWRTELLYGSVSWLIMEAGLIAVMVWLARPQQRVSAGEAV